MSLIALGGAAYVAFVSEPTPTLTIRGPGMPWFVSEEDCQYPSYKRVLPNYDWGGGKPGLALCFLALDNGEIPYEIAPTPPEEQARLAREEAEDRARMARGEPPRIRITSPWYYTDDSYTPRIEAYVAKSIASLKLTSELRDELANTAWRWRAHKKAFNDAAPWVMGLLALVWVFTAVTGWIIRGFAGVPQGADFRPRAGA